MPDDNRSVQQLISRVLQCQGLVQLFQQDDCRVKGVKTVSLVPHVSPLGRHVQFNNKYLKSLDCCCR